MTIKASNFKKETVMTQSPPSPPRSPFATRLSGRASETELRIRSIFQRKKKRPPVWSMVLAGLLILSCGSLVSCQIRQEVPSDTSVSAPASDPAPATRQEAERSVRTDVRTLRTASGRELTVTLEEQKMEGEYLENWYQVTGIQVYDRESLIQAIDPASLEWPQPGFADNGLYVMSQHDYMEPKVLDLNADGSEDLGVMAELLPPKSPSFAWFLWDEDREQLVLSAWLSDFLITARQGTYSLSPDLEFYCNFYTYNADGTQELTQKRQPYRPLIPDDSRPFVWAELYQVTGGKEIFFGQVLQPTD